MTDTLIRDLPDAMQKRLAERAERNGCSIDDEARKILALGLAEPNENQSEIGQKQPTLALAFYEATRDIGGIEAGELPILSRTDMPRAVDFS